MCINKDSILLIGPLATGKSYIAEKLSIATGLHNHPVDKLKWYYRHKNGYNLSTSTKILKTKGFEELIKYAKQFFTAKELNDILHNFNGIVDFGASDTHCQNLTELQQLIDVLDPFNNVFLILPYKNVEKSINLLQRRLEKRYRNDPLKKNVIDSYLRMNEVFINSESSKILAKHIVYAEEKSSDDIVKEILQKSGYLNFERISRNLQQVS